MGFLFRFIFKLFSTVALLGLFILALVLGGIWWFGPKVAPRLVNEWIEHKTGFSSSIEAVGVSLLAGKIRAEKLYLYNPPKYQDKDFVHAYEVSLDFDVWSSLGKTTVLDEVVVDLKSLTWVMTKERDINVQEFVEKLQNKDEEESIRSAGYGFGEESQQRLVSRGLFIKRLVVKLDKVYTIGLPKGDASREQFFVNYSRVFTDVTDLEKVVEDVALDMAGIGASIFTKGFLHSLGEEYLQNKKNGDTDLGDKLNEIGRKAGNSLKKRTKKLLEYINKK